MPQDPKRAFGSQNPPVGEAQVKALLDDLDNAIAGFDERLQAYEAQAQPGAPSGEPRLAGRVFPEIDENAIRHGARNAAAKPAAGAAAPGAPAAANLSSDLLLELAAAANLQQQSQQTANLSQLAAQRRFDQALRQVFDYLHQLTQHVNVLQPELPLIYSLDYQRRFDTLRWAGGVVDYRTGGQSECTLIDSVTLRIRYTTQPLLIEQNAAGADALRKDLQLLNLKVTDETRFDTGLKTAGIRFSIEGVVPLQLNFSTDLKSGLIILRCRNLCGLGLSAYVIAPDAVTRSALDGIGRCLIGKAKQMPAEFNAVAFNRYAPEQKPASP